MPFLLLLGIKIDSKNFSLTDFVTLKSDDIFQKTFAFHDFIDDIKKNGHSSPYMKQIVSPSSNKISIIEDGTTREIIQMNTANYLGLASNKTIQDVGIDAIKKYGISTCSVPLIAGTTDINKELEYELALFKSTQDVCLFPTGYAANVGAISALMNSNDYIVLDKQVHYSIIEGMRISGCKLSSFKHNDINHLKNVLEKIRSAHKECGILVVIEGVYGIDGDIPPLDKILEISHNYNARVMMDECHSTGIMGKKGAGLASHFNLEGKVDIIMDSLSKSLGSFGGYIASTKEVIEYLRYYSKPITFAVGLPPVCIASALAALQYIQHDGSLVEKVKGNAKYMKSNLINIGIDNARISQSAIMSMIVGDESILRKINKELIDEGLWIEGIPYPAVPRGQERLRLRVNANHTRNDLDNALVLIEKKLKKYNIINNKVFPSSLNETYSISGNNSQKIKIVIAQSDEDYQKAAIYLWKSETNLQNGIAWYTIEEKLKYYKSVYKYYEKTKNIVLYAEVNDKVIGTVTAVIDERAIIDAKIIGFIGSLFIEKGYIQLEKEMINKATEFLKNNHCKVIWAPVDVPMVIYGGGVILSNNKELTPFMQPNYTERVRDILENTGFNSLMKKPYYIIDFQKYKNNFLTEIDSHPKLRIRELNKLDWVEESRKICSLMNKTFINLGHHWGFDFLEFEEIARNLLELIDPELWLIAELDNEMVGFISAFPTNSEIIRKTNGVIGVADIDDIDSKLKKSKVGSIVWLSVSPKHQGLDIAKALLSCILQNMKRKRYEYTTITWEIFSPDNSAENLIETFGGDHAEYDIELFSKKV